MTRRKVLQRNDDGKSFSMDKSPSLKRKQQQSAVNGWMDGSFHYKSFSSRFIFSVRLIDGVSKRANTTYTQWLRWWHNSYKQREQHVNPSSCLIFIHSIFHSDAFFSLFARRSPKSNNMEQSETALVPQYALCKINWLSSVRFVL